MRTLCNMLVLGFLAFVFCSCSQRTGYEMFRQMGYLECLKNSPRPSEDCQFAPDYDEYQRELRQRNPDAAAQ